MLTIVDTCALIFAAVALGIGAIRAFGLYTSKEGTSKHQEKSVREQQQSVMPELLSVVAIPMSPLYVASRQHAERIHKMMKQMPPPTYLECVAADAVRKLPVAKSSTDDGKSAPNPQTVIEVPESESAAAGPVEVALETVANSVEPLDAVPVAKASEVAVTVAKVSENTVPVEKVSENTVSVEKVSDTENKSSDAKKTNE